MSELSCNDNKGFQLILENQIVISVQFGPMNYCEHHNSAILDTLNPKKEDNWYSKDAEVAVWRQDTGEWWNFETQKWGDPGCSVQGYQTVNEVANIIAKFKDFNLNTHDILYSHETEVKK